MSGQAKKIMLHLLSGLGDLPGSNVTRTPGEECALQIALKIIKRTPIKQIEKAAHGVKGEYVFWRKQWR